MNTLLPLSTSCFKALCLKGGKSLRAPALHLLPRHLRSLHSHQALQLNRWLLLCLYLVSGFALWIYFNALFCLPTLPSVKPLSVSTAATGPAWAFCHPVLLTLSLLHTLPKTRFLKHIFRDVIITLKSFGSFLFSASSNLNFFAPLSKPSTVSTIQLMFVAFS